MLKFVILLAAVAAVQCTTTPPDCSDIPGELSRRCHNGVSSYVEECANRAAMYQSYLCTLDVLRVCNPRGAPYFPNEAEMNYNMDVLCASASSISLACAREYVHDTLTLVGCYMRTWFYYTPAFENEPFHCKMVRIGTACGLEGVRACDAHTADVMMAANQMTVNRHCGLAAP